MNRDQAARANCKQSREARTLKGQQLEREIRESAATPIQKANMLHTLSKLCMFAADERDQLTRLAMGPKGAKYYDAWIAVPPDGSN